MPIEEHQDRPDQPTVAKEAEIESERAFLKDLLDAF